MRSPIIDAHLHVPKTKENAISVLLRDMDRASVEKSVLIVNTEDELDTIKRNWTVFLTNRDRFHVVSGVNIRLSDPLGIHRFFADHGVDSEVKLHPKMYGYTMEDFRAITQTLSSLRFRVITIDSLCFGEQLENHIGMELAIGLAQFFPDKRIVIAHSGFIKLLECQMYTRNLQNVCYDLSFTASYINHTSVRLDMVNFLKYTSGRIMFGSDYPDFDFERAVGSLDDLCSEAMLTDDAWNQVFRKNALKVYWDRLCE